jgi:hypothetical protein
VRLDRSHGFIGPYSIVPWIVDRLYAGGFIPHAEAIVTRYRDTTQQRNSIYFLNQKDAGKAIASPALLYYMYAMVPCGTVVLLCNNGFSRAPVNSAFLATFRMMFAGVSFCQPVNAALGLTSLVRRLGATTVPWRSQGLTSSGLKMIESTAGFTASFGDRGKPAC